MEIFICLAIKALESLINSQIEHFWTDNHNLDTIRSGFRSGHSTVTAETLVIIDVSFDKKQHRVAVFVCFSKGFHLVCHKFKANWFQWKALGWFRNYLSDRTEVLM